MEDYFLLDQSLTSEERLARDSIRSFVDEDVIPIMGEAFEKGEFPQHLMSKMAELGLFGLTLPAEYGGSQANYVTYGLVCQELERGDSALRSFVSVQNSLCIYPIFSFGSEAQKKKFLPKMVKGEYIGCFGLTEPDAGSDPSSMKTTAKKVDGGWLLNGSKYWITNAPIADLAIVWAKTIENTHSSQNSHNTDNTLDSRNANSADRSNSDNTLNTIRGFIVEKDFPGFHTQEIQHKLSLRTSCTGELTFSDCFVPDQNLLPGTEKGLSAALSCLTQARYGIAWGAIGAAMGCYETALMYCKERKQFNKPIAAFQLIQKDLVAMCSEILKAQCLNLQLGRLKDKNLSNYAMVSLAKMNACREALKIARLARNLLGANGISLEYPVIRHMVNLESVFTYEGTDNIHHLIVGKYLTGQDALS